MLIVLGAFSAVAVAGHRSGELGLSGVSERQLRAFETKVLGPAHAAEHARMRRALRKGRRPPPNTHRLAAAAAPDDPSVSGRWGARFSIPVMAINAAMLPTGKVLWYAYPQNPSVGGGPNTPNTAQGWLWDPAKGSASGAFNRVDPPLWRDPADGVMKPANIWCSGISFLADGRVLVTGGNLAYQKGSVYFKGLNKVYTFNPFNETWTEQPDMKDGRWYPSQNLMADGRTVILDGIDSSGGAENLDVEIFTPSADLDGRGTVSVLGERGGSGPPAGGLYPHLFSMPSGRVMVAGPYGTDTWFLEPPGPSNLFDWEDYPDTSDYRRWGTAVLMPGGPDGSTRVMQLGGSPTLPPGDDAVATTEMFDEANPGLGWQARPSMNVGRGHHNTVLLPDGSMVTVGGGYGYRPLDGNWAAGPEHKAVELWDPATGQWTLGPPQVENRAYHSTALLLPDGRVVSAGDDFHDSTNSDTAEIYEPPYLFKGPRPTITAGPTNVRFGTNVDVTTPDTNVTGAALIAPGATTHANDMNQRYISLRVTQRPGGVTLTAPASPQIATPGYYMLFLLNDRGVPSVARFIRLGFTSDPPEGALPGTPLPGAKRACINARAAVKGRTLGPARLRRTRSRQRLILKKFDRRSDRNLDRYCVVGGGELDVGYPTTKLLSHALRRSERHSLRGRVVFTLTSSRRFSLNGIRPGDSARAARRRLRGERRFRVGGSLWYVATHDGGRALVKTRAGRVRALGLGDPLLTDSRVKTARFLRSWQR